MLDAPRLAPAFVLLCAFAGCSPDASVDSVEGMAQAPIVWAHPDSLSVWALPAGSPPAMPVALRLEELGVDPRRFEPLRARYLQTIYDAPDRPGSRVLVTIQIDRAVQSGVWDGIYPARIEGLREPGLIVDWQIQNSIYNAFDRVLTDQHLGMRQRVMPGGASVAGLVLGEVVAGVHSRRVADLSARIDSTRGPVERIVRTPLPNATVNVLTAPLLLSQTELEEGAVFSLPGYALIGGPDGYGAPWLGLYEVTSVRGREVNGTPQRVMEILSARRPQGWSGPSDLRTVAGRVTRLVVSNHPPYLLSRGDYQVETDGRLAPVREHLHLVGWAPLPLPGADLVPDSMWQVLPDTELFNLEPSQLPRVLDPAG